MLSSVFFMEDDLKCHLRLMEDNLKCRLPLMEDDLKCRLPFFFMEDDLKCRLLLMDRRKKLLNYSWEHFVLDIKPKKCIVE